jgi:hypothetical protein
MVGRLKRREAAAGTGKGRRGGIMNNCRDSNVS